MMLYVHTHLLLPSERRAHVLPACSAQMQPAGSFRRLSPEYEKVKLGM